MEFQDGALPNGSYSGTQDSFLRQTSPANNFGSETFLSADGVDQDPSNGLFGEVVSVIQWDISAIPSGATVQSATITLDLFDTSSGPYEIYSVDTAWTESGVIYSDIASNLGSIILGTISPGTIGTNAVILNADGINLVQGWVNGSIPNNGIVIRSGGTNNGIDANSRETVTAVTRPKLTIDYTPSSGVILQSFQNGVSPDPSYSGTEDSYIRETSPTSNFGNETFLSADGTDQDPSNGSFGELQSVIQWDISAVPASATVQSAFITLELFDISSGPYEIYSIDVAWNESTVNWNDIAPNTGTTLLGTIPAGQSGENVIILNTDGIQLIQSWVDGSIFNNGIVIKSGGTNNGIDIRSSEAAIAGTRPKLTLAYSGGSPTQMQTLISNRDSYVDETTPNTNFGNEIFINADGDNGGGELISVIGWDLSFIPAGSQIQAVSVILNLFDVSSGNYEIVSTNASWDEGTVTWNNLGSNFGTTVLGTIPPFQFGENIIDLNQDGIDLVQDWVDGAIPNNGIAIRTGGTTNGIDLNSREAASGQPQLKITFSSGPSQQLIKYGDVILDSIDPIGGTDQYLFNGQSGDKILIRMDAVGVVTGSGPFVVLVQVFRENGILLCSRTFFRDDDDPPVSQELQCTLDQTGTHTILVQEEGGNASSFYDLLLQRLNPWANSTPIAYGDTAAGSINPAIELDGYTFSGTSGDQIFIRMAADFPMHPHLQVYREDGTLLCNKSSRTDVPPVVLDLVCTLDETGTYLIVAGENGSDESGNYQLLLQTLPWIGATPIAYDDIVTGNFINPAVKPVGFTFSGTLGDKIFVRTIPEILVATDIRVYRDDGTVLCFDDITELMCTLDQTGTFLILVGDAGGNQTWNFDLMLQNLPWVNPTSISYGNSVAGTINPGVELDGYTFSGNFRDEITIRMDPDNPVSASIRVFQPNNILLCQGGSSSPGVQSEINCTLNQTGVHTIVVGDIGGNDSGNYLLELEGSP